MQYGCAGNTDQTAKCPTTTFTLQTMGACKTDDKFESPDPGSDNSKYYEFSIDSSPVEWSGYCRSGNCETCAEGETRCPAGNGNNRNLLSNPQTCAGGEWVSTTAFNRQEPALNVQSRALIAIAVMISMCFLALLGVIAAVIMLMQVHESALLLLLNNCVHTRPWYHLLPGQTNTLLVCLHLIVWSIHAARLMRSCSYTGKGQLLRFLNQSK